MKSRIFGILLIFCFVAPVATTYIIVKYQKKQVKREVKRKMIAGMDKEELVLMKFTDKEKQTQLHWKHSKEFEYKGEMYDVVETKINGDTTYYWLWWDNEETKLEKQLNQLVSFAMGKDPKKTENQKRLHNFFKSLFISYYEMKARHFFFEFINIFKNKETFYLSFFTSPIEPPPEKS